MCLIFYSLTKAGWPSQRHNLVSFPACLPVHTPSNASASPRKWGRLSSSDTDCWHVSLSLVTLSSQLVLSLVEPSGSLFILAQEELGAKAID